MSKVTRTYDKKRRIIEYHDDKGRLHREDGPAFIHEPSSITCWYQRGLLHRVDGPAWIVNNGFKAWYYEGKHHREDGPATIPVNGEPEYWLNDKQITDPKIIESIKLKEAFKEIGLEGMI